MHKTKVAMQAQSDTMTSSERAEANAAIAQFDTQVTAQKLLVENENIVNDQICMEKQGLPIKYGEPIQLRHMKSRAFLTMSSKNLAPLEKSCSLVSLTVDEGTCFIAVPRFKLRQLGEQMVYGDSFSFSMYDNSDLVLHVADERHVYPNGKHEGDYNRDHNCHFSSHSTLTRTLTPAVTSTAIATLTMLNLNPNLNPDLNPNLNPNLNLSQCFCDEHYILGGRLLLLSSPNQ